MPKSLLVSAESKSREQLGVRLAGFTAMALTVHRVHQPPVCILLKVPAKAFEATAEISVLCGSELAHSSPRNMKGGV
jgi:hypothetical protein